MLIFFISFCVQKTALSFYYMPNTVLSIGIGKIIGETLTMQIDIQSLGGLTCLGLERREVGSGKVSLSMH